MKLFKSKNTELKFQRTTLKIIVISHQENMHVCLSSVGIIGYTYMHNILVGGYGIQVL